ncbi:MAG TPA: hypothetical protein VJ044_19405 [Candidatus Hodarchaeales archaeon]|nr:hypothetical protein [Candidatus Hodarchaeales archaeon]
MSDTTDNYEKEIKVLADAYIESTGSHNRPDITRHDYLRGIIDFCDTIHKRVVEEKDIVIGALLDDDVAQFNQLHHQSAEIERLRALLVVANGCLKEVGAYPITVAKITEALKPKTEKE